MDATLYDAECVVAVALVAAGALFALARRLQRQTGARRLYRPVLAAFVLRVAFAAILSLFSVARALRGPDERTFQLDAARLARQGLFSPASIEFLRTNVHVWWMSLQIRVLDAPGLALRVTHIAIAVAGLALMAAAVAVLADGRAARLAAWLLALEPSSTFFAGVLHKEAFMLLGGGLVSYGCARLWRRPRARLLVPILAGCAIAFTARQYAGIFLAIGAAAVLAHAAVRRGRLRPRSARAAIAMALVLVAGAIPVVRTVSPSAALRALQVSQEANAGDASNLALEPVDFSTPGGIATGLPRRIRDVLLRPYPWQLGNISQQLGVLGTSVALACLVALLLAALERRRRPLLAAAPLLYPAAALLVAYALSSGNAGTSFRYRTHLVVFGICAVAVLTARARPRPRARLAAPAERAAATGATSPTR